MPIKISHQFDAGAIDVIRADDPSAIDLHIRKDSHADITRARTDPIPVAIPDLAGAGDAARIGRVVDDPQQFVQMATGFGGRRMVDWLSGEPLPRIC